MKELDSAKLLSASLKLSETRSTEIVDKLRRELTAKFDSIQLVEGPEGLQGLTGRRGDSGDRGFVGATGARGEQGVQGEQGETGIQGLRGERGGARGEQGIQGEQGVPGNEGEQGFSGEKGDTGAQGEKGVQGVQGVRGEKGSLGDKGDLGLSGKDGIDGVDGKSGIDGTDGIAGEDGRDGKDGVDGKGGKDGVDGKDGPRGKAGIRGEKGVKGDSGSDANVAPLEKKFQQLTQTVETKISRIAYGAVMGTSAGSGEVNLKHLDDVDYNSVSSPTDGHSLVYNGTLGKWQANTAGGGLSNTFTTTVATRTLIPTSNIIFNIGSTTKRYKDIFLANSTIYLGSAQISATGSKILFNNEAAASNSYLQATFATKAIERAALANTNLAITNVKTGLTTTNTALRLLINNRLQVANAASLYVTKAGPTTSGLLAHTGRATISTNLTVSGNTTLTQLILSSVLSPTYGGTGLSSVVSNGILYGANSSILGYLTGTSGQILQIGSSGVPQFDTLDGGAF